jgi:hypothetical protein
MNCILSPYTNELLHKNLLSTASDNVSLVKDSYATVPMEAFQPSACQRDEEELYTSFEHAISERLMSLHPRMERLSGSLSHSQHTQQNRDAIEQCSSQISMSDGQYALPLSCLPILPLAVKRSTLSPVVQISRVKQFWRQSIIFIVFGLMCMLAGFDLMGLLVLYLH